MKRNAMVKVTAEVSKATRGVVVSVPDAGFFVVGEGGERHPLDGQTFTTGREARAALATFNG